VSINDALRLAQEADLDLVEVAPTARPPVCKLMDYGKFKYESALKARESRKNQAQTVIKEIKIRPKIDPHDYGTKKGHVERFLKQGDKVKITIMFRGREQSRPELGYKLLQRLAGDVEELGFVESQPKQDGRNMIMVIGPHRKKADVKPVKTPDRASARASAPGANRDEGGEMQFDLGSLQEHASQLQASPAYEPQEQAPDEQAPQEQAPQEAVAAPERLAQATAAGPASRTSRAFQAAPRSSAPTSAGGQGPRQAAPRPGPSSARPGVGAGLGSGTGAGSAASAGPSFAASGSGPRPAPRPAAADRASGAQRSGQGSEGAPRPAAPRPGPSSGGPRPAPPRPAAPRPGPVPSGAPRPAAPKPTAPRVAAAKPGEGSAVPTPRPRPENDGSTTQAGG
jgi:translation initiation factor IF-3